MLLLVTASSLHVSSCWLCLTSARGSNSESRRRFMPAQREDPLLQVHRSSS